MSLTVGSYFPCAPNLLYGTFSLMVGVLPIYNPFLCCFGSFFLVPGHRGEGNRKESHCMPTRREKQERLHVKKSHRGRLGEGFVHTLLAVFSG